MAQIKAVFFDAAGTLFETREPVGKTYATKFFCSGWKTHS
jgi:FMN phosphatase YigB (HAD superfamily)